MHAVTRPRVAALLAALLLCCLTAGLFATRPATLAQTTVLFCDRTPMGALPPAVPTWCTSTTTGSPTFRSGANSWLDDFNHGLTNADLGSGYQTFEFGSIKRAQHFRHANHWMLDIAGVDADGPGPWNFGGAAMRPDRSFRFENGTLVIEADVAAGIAEYGGAVWPEIVITTGAAPTTLRPNGTYVYETFPGHWTLGCRLQANGAITCALLDASTGGDSSARVWEISHFQCGNTPGSTYSGGCASKFGGHPSSVAGVFEFCQGADPDLACRSRVRWEISANRLAWYINDRLYMEHKDFRPDRQLPAALTNANVYVYFGGFLFKPDAEVVRFHWDRVAVNTAGVEPSPAPSVVPSLSPSPTPSPTASPPPTPSPPPHPSPTPRTCRVQEFIAGAWMTTREPYPCP